MLTIDHSRVQLESSVSWKSFATMVRAQFEDHSISKECSRQLFRYIDVLSPSADASNSGLNLERSS